MTWYHDGKCVGRSELKKNPNTDICVQNEEKIRTKNHVFSTDYEILFNTCSEYSNKSSLFIMVKVDVYNLETA